MSDKYEVYFKIFHRWRIKNALYLKSGVNILSDNFLDTIYYVYSFRRSFCNASCCVICLYCLDVVLVFNLSTRERPKSKNWVVLLLRGCIKRAFLVSFLFDSFFILLYINFLVANYIYTFRKALYIVYAATINGIDR